MTKCHCPKFHPQTLIVVFPFNDIPLLKHFLIKGHFMNEILRNYFGKRFDQHNLCFPSLCSSAPLFYIVYLFVCLSLFNFFILGKGATQPVFSLLLLFRPTDIHVFFRCGRRLNTEEGIIEGSQKYLVWILISDTSVGRLEF